MEDSVEISEQIVNSYRELLNSVGYKMASVAKICSHAAISRNTFYKYYTDKNEVTDALFYEDMIKPTVVISEHLSGIDEMDSMTSILLRNTYQRIFENRTAYENLLSGMGKSMFIERIHDVLLKWTVSFAEHYGLSEREQDYAANLLSSSQVAVLVNWIEKGFDTSPEHLAEFCEFWRFSSWRTLATRRSQTLPLKDQS
jgi:AcrR family transcriptional regulator